MKQILDYIESMRCLDGGYGRYRYAACQSQPILYASVYAVLARSLLGELDIISDSEKKEWISYIQSFQADDGFFKDVVIAHKGSWYMPPHMDWCGWWHLSCHVIIALTALGTVAERKFRVLEPFYDERYLHHWLNKRDFNKIDFIGNEVLNLGSLLQYTRDFQNEKRAAKAMEIILDWLDETQDTDTGLWGKSFATPKEMNAAYQGAYHFYLLYVYDKRKIACLERIIDSMLSLQTAQGGFGIHENTGGCEDIDAIDPLARLYFLTDYRRDEIKSALERAFKWVLLNRTPDGGFAFIKDSEMLYGSNFMFSGKNEGSTFATWWRMLSLAIMSKVVTNHKINKITNIPWQFIRCPGYQFWS